MGGGTKNGEVSDHPSPNAQAILLLTAPLIAGRRRGTVKPLSLGEYHELARHLHDKGLEPADLLDGYMPEVSSAPRMRLDSDRLERLLGRGFLLAQAMERWSARAIWTVTRADPDYPRRFRERMRRNAPPVLHGCGDRAGMSSGGLAVVGSRRVNDALIRYTEDVGRLAAQSDIAIVSGGARGVDQAAMRGATEAEGRSVGVLANGLERAALNRENREALMDGRLVLVSPYDPSARFLVGHAMQRNKQIYALADAALVVNSDYGHGGTWAGATEQLGKLRFVPVHVRAEGDRSEGIEKLVERGAVPWRVSEGLGKLMDRGTERPDSGASGGAAESSTAPAPIQGDMFAASPASGKAALVRERATASGEMVEEAGGPTTVPAEPSLRIDRGPRRLLIAIKGEMNRPEILSALSLKDWGNVRTRYLAPCLRHDWIEETIPQKPASPRQRYRLTAAGRRVAEALAVDNNPSPSPPLHHPLP